MSDEFRDGIFNLNTRQFGRVVELIVAFIYKYRDSDDTAFDLIDNGHRIEVKGSRVLKDNKIDLTISELYYLITQNSNRNRLIEQIDATNVEFDCNIQQIKIDCFDYLYYCLFFSDTIEIFKIASKSIPTDKNIGFSDKQHRGNVGEGQFHITQANYAYHKSKYFNSSLTYEELKMRLLECTSDRQ